MGRLGIVFLVAAIVAGVAAGEVRAKQPSVAQFMAQIDCNCDHPSAKFVAPYQHLLLRLVTRKCKERAATLAGEILNTQKILAKDGKGHYKLLTLMRLLDKSIPNSIGFRQSCAGVLASLIVLIEG